MEFHRVRSIWLECSHNLPLEVIPNYSVPIARNLAIHAACLDWPAVPGLSVLRSSQASAERTTRPETATSGVSGSGREIRDRQKGSGGGGADTLTISPRRRASEQNFRIYAIESKTRSALHIRKVAGTILQGSRNYMLYLNIGRK